MEKSIIEDHTCLDISYTFGIVSQFMHKPNEEHLKAILMIVKYLKNSLGTGLFTRVEKMEVEI